MVSYSGAGYNFNMTIFAVSLFFPLMVFAQSAALPLPEAGPEVFDIRPILNVGAERQTKLGGLSVGSGLKDADIALKIIRGRLGVGVAVPQFAVDVFGQLNAEELCLGGDCRDAWPAEPGETGFPVYQCPPVNSGAQCGGNVCAGQLTTESSCQAITAGSAGCTAEAKTCTRKGGLEPYDKNYKGVKKEDPPKPKQFLEVRTQLQVNGQDILSGPDAKHIVIVPYGKPIHFAWTAQNAFRCYSESDVPQLNGSRPIGGSFDADSRLFVVRGPTEPVKKFAISCSNLIGAADAKTVIIQVKTDLNVEVKVNGQDFYKGENNPLNKPIKMNKGDRVVFSWVSNDADSCESISEIPEWNQKRPLNGEFIVEKLDLQLDPPIVNFTISCSNITGNTVIETGTVEMIKEIKIIEPIVSVSTGFQMGVFVPGKVKAGETLFIPWSVSPFNGVGQVEISLWRLEPTAWELMEESQERGERPPGKKDTCGGPAPKPYIYGEEQFDLNANRGTNREFIREGIRVMGDNFHCPAVPNLSPTYSFDGFNYNYTCTRNNAIVQGLITGGPISRSLYCIYAGSVQGGKGFNALSYPNISLKTVVSCSDLKGALGESLYITNKTILHYPRVDFVYSKSCHYGNGEFQERKIAALFSGPAEKDKETVKTLKAIAPSKPGLYEIRFSCTSKASKCTGISKRIAVS